MEKIKPSDFKEGQMDNVSELLNHYAREWLEEQEKYNQRRKELVLKKAS